MRIQLKHFDMKVLLYTGSEKIFTQSGIGEALRHQKNAEKSEYLFY